MMDLKELRALIELLDDKDEEVYRHVCERLVILGESAIPHLEEAWETSFDHLIQQRIEDIIHQIQFDNIAVKLQEWKAQEGNLMDGAFLVARYQYPDLDEPGLRKMLHQMAKQAEVAIVSKKLPLEKIKVINHILFDVYGFAGNKANLRAPHNYYINHVLETKKGAHVTLGIIYIYLAEQLGLPVKGIQIPDHFILAFMDHDPVKQLFQLQQSAAPAFYINPFSKGAVFSKRDIDHYLQQAGAEVESAVFYTPTPEIEIIQNMLVSLRDIYDELGFDNKVKELSKLVRILDT